MGFSSVTWANGRCIKDSGLRWNPKLKTEGKLLFLPQKLANSKGNQCFCAESLQNHCKTIVLTTRECCGSAAGICGSTAGVLQEHCQNTAGVLREHCGNTLGTMRKYFGNAAGGKVFCRNAVRILREHCGSTAGVLRESCGNTAGALRDGGRIFLEKQAV